MQPGSESEQPQGPAPSTAGWPPAPGWGPALGEQQPPDRPVEPAPAARGPRSRPGLVVLVALLVEIIVIAAADNQWVAERVSDSALDHQGTLGADLAFALLTYQWRVTRSDNDIFHALYGQFALLGTLLVLTAVLVLVVSRGATSFSRVFLGTWVAVIAASGVGALVRGLVVDGRLLEGRSRFQYGLFGPLGPSQYVFVVGVGLGLLVGIGAGLTARAAGREPVPAAPPAMAPPPTGTEPPPPPPTGTEPPPPPPTGTEPPPPPRQDANDKTAVLPAHRVADAPGERAESVTPAAAKQPAASSDPADIGSTSGSTDETQALPRAEPDAAPNAPPDERTETEPPRHP